MAMSLEKTGAIMLALIVVVVFLIILFKTNNPIKSALKSVLSLEEKNETKIVELGQDLPFLNEFYKNYQECKLSPSTQCFCQFTFTDTSKNYILEIANEQETKKTALRLYSNAEISDCNISPTAELAKISSTEKYIENDLLYFENVLGDPSRIPLDSPFSESEIIRSQSEYYAPTSVLDLSEFSKVDKLYLGGKELCSQTDVAGRNSIDLTQGVLYKFDQEKTALIKDSSSLQRCGTVPGINEAYLSFTNFVSKINECKTGVCSYPISISDNFDVFLENKKVVLKYKNTEIISSQEISKNLCKFIHFTPSLRNEQELTTLNLKDFLQVDIYPFEDKICFLPYDDNLARERLIERSRTPALNEPLVPEI